MNKIMKNIITLDEYEVLSEEIKNKYEFTWQHHSFNFMWIRGYSQDYPIRKMYYLKKSI